MRTVYVRNVPDQVVQRLEEIARRDGTSVNAVVVQQLESLARMVQNTEIFDARPSLEISVEDTLRALDEGRAGR